MLVDAGDGVVSQLLAAGIALESITQIALTHMHWDHILGYPALIWGRIMSAIECASCRNR